MINKKYWSDVFLLNILKKGLSQQENYWYFLIIHSTPTSSSNSTRIGLLWWTSNFIGLNYNYVKTSSWASFLSLTQWNVRGQDKKIKCKTKLSLPLMINPWPIGFLNFMKTKSRETLKWWVNLVNWRTSLNNYIRMCFIKEGGIKFP